MPCSIRVITSDQRRARTDYKGEQGAVGLHTYQAVHRNVH